MKGAWKDATGRVAGACLVVLLAHGASTAADVVVLGSDEKRTYDCEGGNAVVNGGDNVLTLRNCATVTVNGGENAVDAGSAHVISVLGSGNRITWTEAPGRGRPKIVNMGTDNVIASSEGREASADGDDVVISAGSGSVVVKSEGKGRGTGSKGKDVVVLENSRKETLDCGGGTASVIGNSNVLTLRNCSALSVAGNSNRIDAGETPDISVIGRSNQITWTEGPGGTQPTVSNLGQGNVVKRRP